MLTCPSDSLPQVVCPMDEDAIPPNPFCSAPPHSEPPLLPLSSITPSCGDDGISGVRRSGRIQGVRDKTPKKQSQKDSRAAQRPSRQNPSPAKREREDGMVQVSQSLSVKLLRHDKHAQQMQNKDELDCDVTPECPTKDKECLKSEADVSATKNVVEEFAGSTTQDLDASQLNVPKSDMDTCGELAVENASAMKSWVIGPLFQSFKSKMASFTEIVMSPVKLFKANSPPQLKDHPDNQDELEAVTASEPGENRNEDTEADQLSSSSQMCLSAVRGGKDLEAVALPHSENLLSDVDLPGCDSRQVDECALPERETNSNDSVPLQHGSLPLSSLEKISESDESVHMSSSVPFQPFDSSSASSESKLKMSSEIEEPIRKRASQLKPVARKRTGNRSALQKGSSNIFPSEVKKEATDPGTNGEHVSEIHSVKTNISDPCDTVQTQSSPSVYYTPPDMVCPPHEVDDGRKRDIDSFVRKSLRNKSRDGGVSESPPKPLLDAQLVQKQQLECKLNTESVENSATSLGKAKRRLKLTSQSDIEQDLVKRKRLADKHKKDTKSSEVSNVATDSGILRGSKLPRKEVVSTDTVLGMEITLNPARTRLLLSAGTKRKGRGGQTQTENHSGAVLVCSLDQSNGIAENNQKDGKRKGNSSGSNKRLKKSTSVTFCEPDMNTDSMDLETTVTATSTTDAQEEPLFKGLVQPLAIKLCRPQLASSARQKNVRTKKDVSPVFSVEPSQNPNEFMTLSRGPLKRKKQKQESSAPELCSTLVSTSSAEFTPTDCNSSQLLHKEESLKTGLRQLSKRLKKDCVRSVKSNGSNESQLTERSIDNSDETVTERQSKDKITGESLHFQTVSVENNQKPVPSPYSDCFVQLDKHEVKHVSVTTRNWGKDKTTGSLTDEVFPTDFEATNNQGMTFDEIKDFDMVESCTYRVSASASELKHSARRVKNKKRIDSQRRKCRVLLSKRHSDEEEINSATSEDADLLRAGPSDNSSCSRRLLRSYSCPEIPSLLHQDTHWSSSLHSPQHSRIHTSYQHQSSHIPPVPHNRKSPRRTRRHTVCSMEVEREIAPLCLRKEVYPSRRSAPYGSITQHLPPSVPLSPSTSLSALASGFLSSPLAFLSKKMENRGAAASSSSCSHVSSPSSSSAFTSLVSPSSSSAWHLPGFLPRADTSSATTSSTCSVIPLDCEIETRKQIEEEEDGEDTSCSSQEFEDVGLREEKALSDSEIKVVQKLEERGKVSSIRIRKTLPKPQNNLTPMGLPKPIRVKKKEFSLEEIYTNKNFTKPPESRLETIFEIPLSRRNGSQSLFGQKRVKRFVEFPEVGIVRKPKKPLVGSGKAATSTSRPRRGGYNNPKDEPSISGQELDSLLCAKLDQLDLWLTFDEKDS